MDLEFTITNIAKCLNAVALIVRVLIQLRRECRKDRQERREAEQAVHKISKG